jgi:hypothetical protein
VTQEELESANQINDILESILHETMENMLPPEDVPLYQRTIWNMTSHTPSPADIRKIELLRTDFKVSAGGVIKFCPDGRERSLALTHLEQALMWAVAGIARKEPDAPTS